MPALGLLLLKNWKWLGLAALIIALAVQGGRLDHAKKDLAAARAAQINPATKKPWREEAIAATRDLDTCRGNTSTLTAALQRQNDAVTRMAAERDLQAARAAEAARASRTALQRALEAASVLAAPLKADGVCLRVQEFDARLLRGLQ